ncbi:MAG: TonB-dependent receptor [Bryobacteraceae bacterium]
MKRYIAALPLLFAGLLLGQGERGNFNGTVVDPSGSSVAGATVVAVNVETNVETRVVTTNAGVYRISLLPRGTYRLTASAAGFKTATRENVILSVAQTLGIDFTLEVGAVTEQITVSSDPPLLETSTAEIGRYVTNKEFNTWPIAVGDGRRQIQQFIFSSLPGTVGGTFQGSINGGQFYSHEILIEGMALGRFDLQGGSNNEFSPSAEAVSEFKMQTGAIGAQYGGAQTAVANFAVKSGTNELHGSAYYYTQNDALRANTFANNAIGQARAPFKQSNYGYSVGGPVYIPKVYDGRNKTFFFHNFETTRERNFTSVALTTLPVNDFKRGDFSRLFDAGFTGRAASGGAAGTDALGRTVRYGTIYDPTTIRQVNGVTVRDPFPGNVVPQNRWSPVTRNILEKAPIDDPVFDRMLQNIPNLSACCPVFDERMYAFKGDHNFSSKHRLSGYYNHTYRQRNNSPGGRWGPPPGSPTNVYQNQYTPGRLIRMAEDWTISPTVLNHFAIGYNRFGNVNESVHVDQNWPEQIGLQNVAQTHFPQLFFDGQPHLGGGIGAGGRLGSGSRGAGYNGSTIIQNDLTIIRGKHNFKTGLEMRKYYYNVRNKSGSGDFRFSSLQTQLPGFADATGHAFASFLLGAVNSTTRSITPSNFGHRVSQPAFYFMDDWKVNRKLTLNLGVRWEVIGGLYEVAGRMSAIDLNAPNPGAGSLPGALVFAEDLGRKSFQDRNWKQFSPRFGFAYAATDKLVVRGGYGINNTPPISNGFGFGGTFGYNGSIDVSAGNTPLQFPEDPVLYLHDRYPDFQGTLPNKNPALSNNLNINYIAPDSSRLPYVQNYNLGFQYQLPGRFVVETSFIGNKGTRLEAGGLDNLNQLPVSALALGDRLFEPLSRNPGLAPLPFAGFNGTVSQALRPYPQFLDITQQWANFGISNYNSLQIQATRHFSDGLAVLASYTFSKATSLADSALDAITSQDVFNRGLEKSVTGYHIPQFFKLSWIYDLPIGPGKLVNIPGIAGKIIGGWTLTGIHNYRSGDALSVSTAGLRQSNTTIFNRGFRPDWISGVPVVIDQGDNVVFGTGAGTQYLNPAAFAQVPRTANNVPLRLGTAPRILPNVRGPSRLTEDFGIMKRFNFSETRSFEFRSDWINAFNRAGRGNPVTNITDPLFGKITGAQQGPRTIQLSARITF